MITSKHQQKGSIVSRFLDSVEKVGSKLSDSSVLFFLMCAGLVIMTWVISLFNVSVKHPGTHQAVYIKSIISHDGFTMIMNDMVKNFSEFPALGLVLAVVTGIGVAEKTGYFDKLTISIANRAPRFLILPIIILIGILSSTAGDAATIILSPLVAVPFTKIDYRSIVGLTVAHASAIGGSAANVVIGMQDVLAYLFTESATRIVSDSIKTNVAMNWYFVAVNVAVLFPTILLATIKLTILRLGQYDGRLMHDDHEKTSSHIIDKEAHALKWANTSFIVTIILLIIIAIPEYSFLRSVKTGSLLNDVPLINGVGLIILVISLAPGLIYGILSREIKSIKDLGKIFGDVARSMGTSIVIVFFIVQLLVYSERNNLRIIAAVRGAKLLEHQNGIVLILGIIVPSATVNMLIGSVSAKWGTSGPIFVPMLILISFHLALTQVIYRVGDLITNPITPMMPYLPLLLTYAQKHDKRMELGALFSNLMLYLTVLSIAWIAFVITRFLSGIPVGPGEPIFVK